LEIYTPLKTPLPYFVSKQFNNGYNIPIGTLVVGMTIGPPTMRKQGKLERGANIVRRLVNRIDPKHFSQGIEKILIGFEEPEENFSVKDNTIIMCGDIAGFQSATRHKIKNEPDLKKQLINIITKESPSRAGMWTGPLCNDTLSADLPAVRYDTIIVSDVETLVGLIESLEKYGIVLS